MNKQKIKLSGGNVHNTYLEDGNIVQYLNKDFEVPSKSKTNKVVDALKKCNIKAANVLFQNKEKRVYEKLDGKFYDVFTLSQAKKAARFLAKIHYSLNELDVKSIDWHMIKEMDLLNVQPIFGDVKANNILWQNNQPVGIVDYDTICQNHIIFDIANAIVMWQKDFSKKYATEIVKEYNEESKLTIAQYNMIPEYTRKFILLLHKKFSQEYLGVGYMKKSKKYLKMRLVNLNKKYEKSIDWRSI